VRSCDPGASAPLASPDDAILRAQNVLAAHNELEVGFIRDAKSSGLPIRVAKCAALGFVRSPQLELILSQPENSITAEAVRNAIKNAAPAVRQACGL
jgi:hypothetical protein